MRVEGNGGLTEGNAEIWGGGTQHKWGTALQERSGRFISHLERVYNEKKRLKEKEKKKKAPSTEGKESRRGGQTWWGVHVGGG